MRQGAIVILKPEEDDGEEKPLDNLILPKAQRKM